MEQLVVGGRREERSDVMIVLSSFVGILDCELIFYFPNGDGDVAARTSFVICSGCTEDPSRLN